LQNTSTVDVHNLASLSPIKPGFQSNQVSNQTRPPINQASLKLGACYAKHVSMQT